MFPSLLMLGMAEFIIRLGPLRVAATLAHSFLFFLYFSRRVNRRSATSRRGERTGANLSFELRSWCRFETGPELLPIPYYLIDERKRKGNLLREVSTC